MGKSKKAIEKAKKAKAAAAASTTDEAPFEVNDRSCTGTLVSHPLSRDVQVRPFAQDSTAASLTPPIRKYGFVGPNGSGKSTVLNAIGNRDIPIPEHIDIFHLTREVEASDMTALECVISVDEERTRLEKEAEALLDAEGAEALLEEIYERLDEMDADLAEKKGAEILFGLGFDKAMQNKKTSDFSGGWRMRIALARALFVMPHLLLLDEPTNHLDLEACVWLEEYLANHFHNILVLISHSQDFMNGVCTNIVHLHQKKLVYYGGNYNTYCKTREELEEQQMKKYNWEQDQIKHMKEYIARFGHGSAKLAKQAQSKEKTLAKMEREGLTQKVQREKTVTLRFSDCGKLAPPVLQFTNVSFQYPGTEKPIYVGLEFGVDLDSRIALVGPNGAGKSTLIKLMCEQLLPTDGMVRRHTHLRLARYHQHLSDQLEMDLSPLEYMMKCFPNTLEVEAMRSAIGRFGLTGQAQLSPIKNLSDGQRSRVCFAWLAWTTPHVLLLDEPTNHLDIETIDALADAINAFEGGVVLVSHDFRLISQTAKEIWVCENQQAKRWDGDILSYKNHLRVQMGLDPVQH